ncbi:hypothetical protein A3K73_07720 [Candidatus Pacearchaeota archaeon RBG_13_36_9]|nr:MAG: hypothetical protein A3K73_07720 [Candidatus Pacearchaeota archaeon RBG_13_36_9]
MPEGYIQQLADYIKRNLAKGYTLDSLRIALENQDYSKISIEQATGLAHKQLAAEAPKIQEKPVIKYQVVSPVVEEKKSFWQKLKSWIE